MPPALIRRFLAVILVATLFAAAGYGQTSSGTAEDEIVLTPATLTNAGARLLGFNRTVRISHSATNAGVATRIDT